MHRKPLAIVLAALAVGSPALAAPVTFNAFGHSFEIRSVDYFERLLLNGEVVHENGMLFIDAVGFIGDVGVIVGTSATGGNLCGVAPFVVSFPPGGTPVFDGPIDTCAGLTATFEGDAVVFRGYPSVMAPGEHYLWRPHDGFVVATPIPFVPSKEPGWPALLGAGFAHPFSIFDYADLGAQANALMGPARVDVLNALAGPGQGVVRGDLYVGEACFPHACPYAQVLLVGHGPSQRLFMAWRIDGVETIAPDVGLWPEAALAELRRWQAGG